MKSLRLRAEKLGTRSREQQRKGMSSAIKFDTLAIVGDKFCNPKCLNSPSRRATKQTSPKIMLKRGKNQLK